MTLQDRSNIARQLHNIQFKIWQSKKTPFRYTTWMYIVNLKNCIKLTSNEISILNKNHMKKELKQISK